MTLTYQYLPFLEGSYKFHNGKLGLKKNLQESRLWWVRVGIEILRWGPSFVRFSTEVQYRGLENVKRAP